MLITLRKAAAPSWPGMFSCCVDTVGLLVDRTRVVAGFNHTPTYQARGRGVRQWRLSCIQQECSIGDLTLSCTQTFRHSKSCSFFITSRGAGFIWKVLLHLLLLTDHHQHPFILSTSNWCWMNLGMEMLPLKSFCWTAMVPLFLSRKGAWNITIFIGPFSGGGGRAAFSTLLGFVLFSIWLHKLEKFTVHGTKFQVVCFVHWLYTAASVCI